MFKKILILVAAICGASMLHGDGKMFWKEQIPPSIPYQRAIILCDGTTETLIVQSQYSVEGSQESGLGWVVPVPSVPEVGAISEGGAYLAFMTLGRISRPEVSKPFDLILPALLILSLGIVLLGLVNRTEKRRSIIQWGLFLLFICMLWAMSIPSFVKVRGDGVEIIDAKSVGIYDVQVIRSERGDLLIAWLNEHGFKYSSDDQAAFDEHIERGWCFVVAKVTPETIEASDYTGFEGLAPPLALRFETPSIIYPLALTATGGHDTEVLIYVLSDTKMLCGDRLKLRYADEAIGRLSRLEMMAYEVDPPEFFEGRSFNYSYLTKFGGLLTPEQMQEDLVFTPAENRTPFREHKIVW